MGYIEDYFHKGINKLKEDDLNRFIEQNIQECLTLDYKDFQKYDDALDLSRHISSFANSVGGLLILGIKERDNFPDSITWGNLSGKSRESLENRLLSHIFPKVNDMRIIPIYQNGSTESGIYLIDIPQGDNPPYMAGDKKYYRRLNFQKQPLEGYEVADYFGRRKKPQLSLVNDHFSVSIDQNMATLIWNVYIKNTGKSVAKELFCRIHSPNANIASVSDSFQTERDKTLRIFAKGIFADPRKHVFFPHPTMENFLGIITFNIPLPPIGYDRDQQILINYELLAENMPILKGNFIVRLIIRDYNAHLDVGEISEKEISDW